MLRVARSVRTPGEHELRLGPRRMRLCLLGHQYANHPETGYCSEPRRAFKRTVFLRYRLFLEQKNLAPSTISVPRKSTAAVLLVSNGTSCATNRSRGSRSGCCSRTAAD